MWEHISDFENGPQEDSKEDKRLLQISVVSSNKIRLEILKLLSECGPLYFSDIYRELQKRMNGNIKRSTLAFHLAVLSNIGLLRNELERKGRKLSKYYLTEDGKEILKLLHMIS